MNCLIGLYLPIPACLNVDRSAVMQEVVTLVPTAEEVQEQLLHP